MFTGNLYKKLFCLFSTTAALSTRALSSVSVSSSKINEHPNLLNEPVTPKVSTPSNGNENLDNPYLLSANNKLLNNINSKIEYSILPPIAKKIPTITELPWDTLYDNYAWIREQQNEETISYIKAENLYTETKLKHTVPSQKELYNEMLSRIVEDDSEYPTKRDNYYYYTRTERGKAYKIYCRKKDDPINGKEEILLDVNEIGKDKKFCSVGSYEVSPDHKYLAYSIDFSGNETYDLKIKNLESGEYLNDNIIGISDNVEWSNDNNYIFYTKFDDTWRPYQLWLHKVGDENSSNDVKIAEEDDIKFRMYLSKSLSNKYIFINLSSAITDEIWYLNLNNLINDNNLNNYIKFNCISPRINGIEYGVSHHNDEFLVLTNEDNCTNFKLMSINLKNVKSDNEVSDKNNWKDVIKHDDDITLKNIYAFEDFIVIEQRGDGLPQFRLRYNNISNTDNEHLIEFPEDAYDVWSSGNAEYTSDNFRLKYTSMITPITTYDYDVNNKKLKELKIKGVNNYDSNNYVTFREFAVARDGTKVPITLICRKDVFNKIKLDNTSVPTHLIGYGSYGYPYDIYFSSIRLSLVDRGILFGYAHIRGGGEYGRKWKLDGKLDKKLNTFTDFIACSEHLLDNKFASTLSIAGGSAGGLLMGAVTNMKPSLFNCVVMDVPFVDVLNTILDKDLPLTAGEWEEWGDPRKIKDYYTIKQYSPYDNIKQMNYPNILLLGGLNDTRVKYWEPTKLCAKLRDYKTDNNDLYLKINMGAGHGGSSGRYERIKEYAFEYSYILDKHNLLNTKNDLIDKVENRWEQQENEQKEKQKKQQNQND